MTLRLVWCMRIGYSDVMVKIVDIAILLTALVGFAMTLSVFRERSERISEYEGYVAKVGRLKIDEPD